MPNRDRPDLGLHVRAQLEQDLLEIDKRYWKQLQGMLMPESRVESVASVIQKGPRLPRPEHLALIIHQYTQTVFYVEASKYPKTGPVLERWLNSLAMRVRKRIVERVSEVELSERSMTLSGHGLQGMQLRRVVRNALKEMLAKWPVPDFPLQSADTSTPIIPPAKWSPTASEEKYSSLVGKQAAAYAAAGVDITSGSPLLMMAVSAGRGGRQAIQPGQNTEEKRRASIEPLLREKGWSPHQWSVEAEVAYHTASDYLSGKTRPNRKSRLRLAKALGINPNQLPD
jgi:lambda repressor-like predicted transcriptional regulator